MLFIFRLFHPINQQCLWLILSLCSIFPVFATPATPSFEQAQAEYQQGNFEQAIHHWQGLLDIPNLETSQRVEIMIQLARTYQALGLSQQALDTLLQAEPLAQNDTLILAKLFTILSDVSLAARQDTQARHYADKSLALLSPNTPILIRATILNNLGNVLTVEAYYTKAAETYARCLGLAQQAGDTILSGRALTNMAYAYLKNGQWLAANNALSAAQQQFESLDNNYAKAFGLISIGELAQRITQPQNHALRMTAYQALNTAIIIAKEIKNNRLISYGYGFLGQLYETAQRYKEALHLTRQAIFYAKLDPASFFTLQDQTSEILYRWQWQLGRVFKAQHQEDEAINAYRSAINSLQPIRQEMAIGYRATSQSFRERLGPIYFEMADLLLQRATRSQTKKKTYLIEALDSIERFKTAELQDYFKDECVAESQLKRTLLDLGHAPHIGIIYPILLPDRIEILLSLSNNIQQFTIPITENQLKDEVNEFRFELETHNTTEFLPYAKRLYHWLIAPLSDLLAAQGVDTLIIVPDGVLRTIPFAALHDGKQFLIDKYAIVTTPGLTLTGSKSTRLHNTKILLSGLSTSVQGYSALSSVRYEINSISKLYNVQNVTQLLDKNFTVDNFTGALKTTNYSILHIASHSLFDSDPQKTFLLTYDGKLSVNQLEELIRLGKRRQESLELLTLSACQTAVGDDQAALGLAGIALKAGARSALASLWFIDDKATTILMKKFYQHLQKNGLPKAKALQAAQQHLIKHYRYQHPAYWAPFLLIGSWK